MKNYLVFGYDDFGVTIDVIAAKSKEFAKTIASQIREVVFVADQYTLDSWQQLLSQNCEDTKEDWSELLEEMFDN